MISFVTQTQQSINNHNLSIQYKYSKHLLQFVWDDISVALLSVSRMGRTTSLWPRASREKPLLWPLKTGPRTAAPRAGTSSRLSSTTTSRPHLGQCNDLIKRCTSSSECWSPQWWSFLSSVQIVPAEREVQSAPQRQDVRGHPGGPQQRHGEGPASCPRINNQTISSGTDVSETEHKQQNKQQNSVFHSICHLSNWMKCMKIECFGGVSKYLSLHISLYRPPLDLLLGTN